MEKFSMNTAKSFLGKNVNLHLRDGSVIVNVQLSEILRNEFNREFFVKCVPYRRGNEFRIPLRNIAWAEQLDINLILLSDEN